MNKKRIFIISLICVCLIAGGITVNSIMPDKTPGELPVTWLEGDFVISPYIPNLVVGYADYVFVGYVDKFVDTEYNDGVPYTNYKVIVLKNIKGELIKNVPIDIQKFGGVEEDGKSITLFKDDLMPEEGKAYIFIAYVEKDGVVHTEGPNSNILLETAINETVDTSKADFGISDSLLDTSDIIKKYENAVANQITYNRERYKSIYENSSSETVDN